MCAAEVVAVRKLDRNQMFRIVARTFPKIKPDMKVSSWASMLLQKNKWPT